MFPATNYTKSKRRYEFNGIKNRFKNVRFVGLIFLSLGKNTTSKFKTSELVSILLKNSLKFLVNRKFSLKIFLILTELVLNFRAFIPASLKISEAIVGR